MLFCWEPHEVISFALRESLFIFFCAFPNQLGISIKLNLSTFQIYYCEYYEKYLEEYERRRRNTAMTDSKEGTDGSETTPSLEASILMDDIMNNGMTFCSIM